MFYGISFGWGGGSTASTAATTTSAVTTTITSSSSSSNRSKDQSTVEFPTIRNLQRRVKLMQIFRRKVRSIRQGDRAGLFVTNFDPNLMERGVCALSGSVRLMDGSFAVVRKVRYYMSIIKTVMYKDVQLQQQQKNHLTVHHTLPKKWAWKRILFEDEEVRIICTRPAISRIVLPIGRNI